MRFRSVTTITLASLALPAAAQIKSTNMPVVRLSLEEAVLQALQNNFSIAIQRHARQAVGWDLYASYGVYDPKFQMSYTHSSQVREGQFNSFGFQSPASETKTDSVANSISGYSPSGLNYNLGLSFNHQTGTAAGGPFDQYGSNLGFTSLTQPLLRDFWIDENRRRIKVAKLQRNISDLDFETQVRGTIRDVQKAYYDLIAADEGIKVALSAHELASQLARDIRRKVEVGEMAPLESKQAESKAQTELAAFYRAQHTRNAAENQIKNLVTQKYKSQYEFKLEPSEKLLAIERRPVDLQDSWKSGLTKRPDYRAQFFAVERERINSKFTRNQLFPHLDLTGAYNRSGLDTTIYDINKNVVSPSDLDGSFHDIRRNTQPSYSIGAVLSTPLTLRTERANRKKSKVTHEQSILALEQLEQQILVDIDNTISLIRSSHLRVQATRSAREFAEEALNAEQKKLEKGVSTPSEVLKRQDDLTRARSDEFNSLLDYNKALTDLDINDGTILERNNIQLESVK